MLEHVAHASGGHIGILVAGSNKLGNSVATWLTQH
jgi:hypothetical protein